MAVIIDRVAVGRLSGLVAANCNLSSRLVGRNRCLLGLGRLLSYKDLEIYGL